MNVPMVRARARMVYRAAVLLVREIAGVQKSVVLTADPLHPPTDPSHPVELCKCPGLVGGAREKMNPYQYGRFDHLEDCEWRNAMCHSCDGAGWCDRCHGDGIEPAPPEGP